MKEDRSALAIRLERLKKASLEAVERRPHLPHTLFWSLFCSEITDIRREKAKHRQLQKLVEEADL